MHQIDAVYLWGNMNPSALTFTVVALALFAPTSYAQVVERDVLHKFSIVRPSAWFQQDRPNPAIRVMLGLEGNGYGGHCNVSVLDYASTVALDQSALDESENKRVASKEYFERLLKGMASDLKVLNVRSERRGSQHGQLVDYAYSYMSAAAGKPIYVRAELFSHSRPGKVFSFTCNTVAITPEEAASAFARERKSFAALASSLKSGT